MKNLTLLLILLQVFNGCSDRDNLQTSIEEKLLGRWEVTETLYILDNGEEVLYTFGEDGDFAAEYSIGIDYSSGFDLQSGNRLNLIWYSSNKGQYFHWELADNELVIDRGTLIFKLLNIEEDLLELELKDGSRRHKMKRLD